MKILILQPRRIGDVVLTTPVIDALRAKFPDARIDFLVEPAAAPVLEGYPGLNDVLVFDKAMVRWVRDIRRRRYDWVLDFMCNPRTAQLSWTSGAAVRAGFAVPVWGWVYNRRVPRGGPDCYAVDYKFRLLTALGVPPAGPSLPRLGHLADRMGEAQGWWEKEGLEGRPDRVALLPMHRHPVRQWPLARWKELLLRLLARPNRVILLFGSPDERPALLSLAEPHRGRVFVIPPGPLPQAAALLAQCRVAVSNDSGLMHLAVAMGVATVALYGPTSPVACSPATPRHRALRVDGLACLTCERGDCPYGHECMTWLSPERVARETETLLDSLAPIPHAR